MKRLILILLCMPSIVLAQKTITVDSVFQKYYEATGGKLKWDGIKTYSFDRKYESKTVASFDAEISGSFTEKALYKNEIIRGRGFVYGIKGTDAWRKVPLGSSDKVTKYQVSSLSAAKQNSMKLELYDYLAPFLDYKNRGFVATLVPGNESLNNKPVHRVELQNKEARYSLLFDAASGLLVQSKLLAGGEEIIRDYSNYVKSAYGISYPARIEEKNVTAKSSYGITSALKVNAAIDPKLFSK